LCLLLLFIKLIYKVINPLK